MYVNEHINSLKRLREYFGVGRPEFYEFWFSLDPKQKRYYASVDLKTGKPCVEQCCTRLMSFA